MDLGIHENQHSDRSTNIMTGIRKAAVVLLSLDKPLAAEVMASWARKRSKR